MRSFDIGARQAMIKIAQDEIPMAQPRRRIPTLAKVVGGVALGAGGVMLGKRFLNRRFPTMMHPHAQRPLSANLVERARIGTMGKKNYRPSPMPNPNMRRTTGPLTPNEVSRAAAGTARMQAARTRL